MADRQIIIPIIGDAKSFTKSMDQATALEEAFARSRCPAVVSFPLRVSSLCALARQYLVEGAVGSLTPLSFMST